MNRNPEPLAYLPPLTGDRLEAYQTMPTLHGHVVSLHYVPEHLLPAYEDQWRAWLMAHDRRLWPEWVHTWSQARARRDKAAA